MWERRELNYVADSDWVTMQVRLKNRMKRTPELVMDWMAEALKVL